MFLSARSTAFPLALALLAAGAVPRIAAAQQARQPCTGTLCDLYYGNTSISTEPPPPAGQKPAPTPLSVPGTGFLGRLFGGGSAAPAAPAGTASGAPAAATPRPAMVQVQGGGLVGMMRGAPAQRCTGTICDFYYGGPPPEEPEPQPAAVAPQATPDAPDGDAPARTRPRRAVEAAPRCAYSAADPWRCYR